MIRYTYPGSHSAVTAGEHDTYQEAKADLQNKADCADDECVAVKIYGNFAQWEQKGQITAQYQIYDSITLDPNRKK